MKGEQYFKDKIDWKFYNALLDRLIKCEDDEIKCELEVRENYSEDMDNYRIIYLYKQGTEQYMNHYVTNTDISKHEKYGLNLVYTMWIYSREYLTKFAKEFKCDRYGYKLEDEATFSLTYKKLEKHDH